MCRSNNPKMNCHPAIGHNITTNADCAKTYSDDNSWIIEQARSALHLSVLESVYKKPQNSVLCK